MISTVSSALSKISASEVVIELSGHLRNYSKKKPGTDEALQNIHARCSNKRE
jgi:hypothetical protein